MLAVMGGGIWPEPQRFEVRTAAFEMASRKMAGEFLRGRLVAGNGGSVYGFGKFRGDGSA
jgi:hypothetical protein